MISDKLILIRATVREMVLVPAEYDTLLKMVTDSYMGRKKRVAARLAQMQDKEDVPYLGEQVSVWADCLMDTCNLAYLTINTDESDNYTELQDAITKNEDGYWYHNKEK